MNLQAAARLQDTLRSQIVLNQRFINFYEQVHWKSEPKVGCGDS